MCSKDEPCRDTTQHCIAVDDETALCLPYADCVYLGDDTQCVASGGSYVDVPGVFEGFLPYQSTVGANPNAVNGHVDPYFYGGGIAGPCDGNAQWVTTRAQSPVGCSARHTVERCRLVGFHCELVEGTTHEFVQP